MEAQGIRSQRSDSAKSWLTWGAPLSAPVLGCVVVFDRPGGNHVGLLSGSTRLGTKENSLPREAEKHSEVMP